MSWNELVKAAGPASRALALFSVAIWGGQFAKLFKPPADDFVTWLCSGMALAGAVIAIVQIGVGAWRSIFNHPPRPPEIEPPPSIDRLL